MFVILTTFLLGVSCVLACNQFDDYCDLEEEEEIEVQQRFRRSVNASERAALADAVSETLDHIFHESRYDAKIRPNYDGPPTVIMVNLAIRSMGPVDESRNIFTLDCYFRQYWTDARLVFNSTKLDELTLNWQFLSWIWRPDTYFLNGQDSYLHKVAVPNRFIRVAPNGKVSYSQRLTVTARCRMNLRKFPHDSQSCPLSIGSFGHSETELLYKWAEKPATLGDIQLSQYHFISWDHGDNTKKLRSGVRSVVFLTFNFERAIGFYVLQVYIPLTIIVMSSWVSFWLIKTEKGQETPARTGLGSTTVLAVVTVGFGFVGRTKPPTSGWVTAMDIYVLLCFGMVFLAFIEFAFISFIGTFVRRMKMTDLIRVTTMRQMTRCATSPLMDLPELLEEAACYKGSGESVPLLGEETIGNDMSNIKIPHSMEAYCENLDQVCLSPPPRGETCAEAMWRRCFNMLGKMNILSQVRRTLIYHNPTEAVLRTDYYSRIVFPSAFVVMNTVYWCVVLL